MTKGSPGTIRKRQIKRSRRDDGKNYAPLCRFNVKKSTKSKKDNSTILKIWNHISTIVQSLNGIKLLAKTGYGTEQYDQNQSKMKGRKKQGAKPSVDKQRPFYLSYLKYQKYCKETNQLSKIDFEKKEIQRIIGSIRRQDVESYYKKHTRKKFKVPGDKELFIVDFLCFLKEISGKKEDENEEEDSFSINHQTASENDMSPEQDIGLQGNSGIEVLSMQQNQNQGLIMQISNSIQSKTFGIKLSNSMMPISFQLYRQETTIDLLCFKEDEQELLDLQTPPNDQSDDCQSQNQLMIDKGDFQSWPDFQELWNSLKPSADQSEDNWSNWFMYGGKSGYQGRPYR